MSDGNDTTQIKNIQWSIGGKILNSLKKVDNFLSNLFSFNRF